jgi:hypothetical protein
MPIKNFLNTRVFAQSETTMMGQAYDELCARLGFSADADDHVTNRVARAILQAVNEGETTIEGICDEAMRKLGLKEPF